MAHPRSVGFQQRSAPTGDLVVHRMPPTPKFRSHLIDRATLPPDLGGHPPSRPRRQQRTHRTNPRVLFDERSHTTLGIQPRPAPLPPPQPHRPTKRRQVHQHHRPIALRPHPTTTGPTGRAGLTRADHHLQRPFPGIVDPDQLHLAQAYQQLAHTRKISFHRGPPDSDVIYQQPIMEDPPSLLADSASPWQIRYSPPIREEPPNWPFHKPQRLGEVGCNRQL